MHYKRLQKYGKKLAVAVLTSAVLLASGATVYADDTGEYLSQANTQEAEVTESTEDVATPAESESGEVESTTRNQEEQKNKATESEIQEEGYPFPFNVMVSVLSYCNDCPSTTFKRCDLNFPL